MGLIANNDIPHGDTIAGLKFIGRRFVARLRARSICGKRTFTSRAALQFSLGRSTARTRCARSPTTEQLA